MQDNIKEIKVIYANSSKRTDLTFEEVREWYKNVAYIILELKKHVKDFSKGSLYKNLINFTNAHQANLLAKNILKLVEIYGDKIKNQTNDKIAYILTNGDFNLNVTFYREYIENDFILTIKELKD